MAVNDHENFLNWLENTIQGFSKECVYWAENEKYPVPHFYVEGHEILQQVSVAYNFFINNHETETVTEKMLTMKTKHPNMDDVEKFHVFLTDHVPQSLMQQQIVAKWLNKPFLMNIHNLVKQVSPVYPETNTWDNTWDKTKSFLLDEEYDKDVVKNLEDELQRNKIFREPVSISVSPKAVVVDENDYDLIIADGTHRVVTHLISSIDDIHVQLERNFSVTYSKEELLVTTVTLRNPNSLTDDECEKLFFKIMDRFRSFRTNNGTWVTCSGGGVSNNDIVMMWDGENYTSEQIGEIQNFCTQFVDNQGKHNNCVFDVKTVYENIN